MKRRRFVLLSLVFSPVLLFAGLETYSRLSERWSEHHNPYITGKVPAERPVTAAAPLVLDDCRAGIQALSHSTSSDSTSAPEGSGASWRQRFESLGPLRRHLAASQHEELVLEFDSTRHLVEIFGFPTAKTIISRARQGLTGLAWKAYLRKTLHTLNTGVSDALQGSSSTRTTTFPWMDTPFEVTFRPCSKTGGALVFFPNPIALAALDQELPNDTPWDIPLYRYKKGIADTRGGTPGTFNLNNVGFRGKDVALPKPSGLYRILCVGGSTTEEGSRDDVTYPALLEKKLNAAFPDNPIEVVNCGTSGLTTFAHLMRFSDYLALEPDLMVVYAGINDVSWLSLQWLVTDSTFWAKVAYSSHLFRRRHDTWLYGSETKLRDDVRAFILTRFKVMRELALLNNVDMAFCSIACPAYESLSPEEQEYMGYRTRGFSSVSPRMYLNIAGEINRQLKEKTVEDGWSYIPVAENFHGGLEYFGDMCHMYPPGIDRKAEIVFQCLRKKLAAVYNGTGHS